MERPGEWVTLDEARRRLVEAVRRLEPVTTSVADALGRVLAREVIAPRDVPPFAASAMDGHAVRAADVTGDATNLAVVGSSSAGQPATTHVGPGQSVAIATGAALPEGADAVCPIENVTIDGASVLITGPVEVGAFVRPAGSDTPAGTTVFPAGTVLTPAHIGVVASLGLESVDAYPMPIVGVLATGDELVEPPDVPGPGQIYDANRPALLAASRAAGCDTVDLGMVDDDPIALEAALVEAATRCDVVVTSGGVSVGVADHAKEVLGRVASGTVQWMEVRIKPGKPFGFGVLAESGVPVVCLPGNPVSALVVFELLVRPALAQLAGRPARPRRTETAVADEPLARGTDGKMHARRVVAGVDAMGTLHVRSAGGQDSHQLRALAEANALVLLDDGVSVGVGDQVRVLVTETDAVAPCGGRP
ncbi:MAG TPA: gephyrin-like molybdotransferase Glp [Acidimicrobiales bacterium]|nr:gephyrin-like molybdotransferase Glp [Acidimicrobiales bacterium]